MISVEEILSEAIRGEEDSHALYTSAVDMVQAKHVKAMLRELAQEEIGHKVMLEKMRDDPSELEWQVRELTAAPVTDYQIGDHLVVRPLGPSSTFQDVCIFASRKEQESYSLYLNLAGQSSGAIRDLLTAMAKDELRHKNLVEGWYEEVIYQEF